MFATERQNDFRTQVYAKKCVLFSVDTCGSGDRLVKCENVFNSERFDVYFGVYFYATLTNLGEMLANLNPIWITRGECEESSHPAGEFVRPLAPSRTFGRPSGGPLRSSREPGLSTFHLVGFKRVSPRPAGVGRRFPSLVPRRSGRLRGEHPGISCADARFPGIMDPRGTRSAQFRNLGRRNWAAVWSRAAHPLQMNLRMDSGESIPSPLGTDGWNGIGGIPAGSRHSR